jgi:hypothetical protein
MPLRRTRLVAAALAVVVVAAATVPAVREPLLRSGGWALVVNEQAAPADAIVLSIESGAAGALEAADLVRAGIATRVAVLTEPPGRVSEEFGRRGIAFEGRGEEQARQLAALGLSDVVRIPLAGTGTHAEAEALRSWCGQHRHRAVVLVAARDHSRRTRRVVNRLMAGGTTRISVRAARHSPFDPDRWWTSRAGIRTGISEFQKLLLDVVLHPFTW